jgi:RNA-directed DNA polymerase
VSPVNTDELEYALFEAERRVLQIQTKLHRWAGDEPHRRFDDLFNLVVDPAFLLVAWDRVRGNKGARTAGIDGCTTSSIAQSTGVEKFLDELRSSLKDRSFRPLPVRDRMIPKAGGKLRRLGIATVTDRVVQASLKLVLEPIFEADFLPCSYGFRPNRRAHDAVAEVRFLASHSYEWIVEGDIKACFDEISHSALLGRVRDRIGDKRVLGLVKAFLKAGILGEDRVLRENNAGTPQGSILSPLLSNVALSVLDEHIAHGSGGPATTSYQRTRRRSAGLPNYRVIRYADDWCLMISGTRADAERLREQAAAVLSTMGLRLSPEKTLITHIDDGLDFLGWRIQRHRKRGTDRHYVYTYPARKSVKAVIGKVEDVVPTNGHRPAARRPPHPTQLDAAGLVRLLPAGGVECDLQISQRLCVGAGHQMVAPKTPPDHREGSAPPLLRRWLVAGHGGKNAVQPGEGTHHAVPIPGHSDPDSLARHGMSRHHQDSDGTCGAPVAVKVARRVREAVRGNGPVERPEPRLGPTSLLPAGGRGLRCAPRQCAAREEPSRS